MSYKERTQLISEIQTKRKSKLITLVLGDRETTPTGISLSGIKAHIAQDQKPVIYDLLKIAGRQKKLDLFIYTRGGGTEAVWPTVCLLREFCEELTILVLFRCHSAGTMICLGANQILMTKLGELSPIDPSTGNQFNPVDEIFKGHRKGISVEDVVSYLELARDEEKFNFREPTNLLEVFKGLTRNVHPLALGNVNRIYLQTRLLAEKLLSLHLDPKKEKERIDRIINALTKELYSHLHFIGRREAIEILGENMVKEPGDDLESLMLRLFELYTEALNLRHNFCFFSEMGNDTRREFQLYSGIAENEKVSFVFRTDLTLYQRSELPPNLQITLQAGQPLPMIQGLPRAFPSEVRCEEWRENEEGI